MAGALAHSAGVDDLAGADDMGYPAVPYTKRGIHVLMPERSAALLDGLFNWLKKNMKPLAIGLFTILGLFFLIKGAMGLIA